MLGLIYVSFHMALDSETRLVVAVLVTRSGALAEVCCKQGIISFITDLHIETSKLGFSYLFFNYRCVSCCNLMLARNYSFWQSVSHIKKKKIQII
jgi:hypothetical protein